MTKHYECEYSSDEEQKKCKRGKRGYPGFQGPQGPTGPSISNAFGSFYATQNQFSLPLSGIFFNYQAWNFNTVGATGPGVSLVEEPSSVSYTGPAIFIENPGFYLISFQGQLRNSSSSEERQLVQFFLADGDARFYYCGSNITMEPRNNNTFSVRNLVSGTAIVEVPKNDEALKYYQVVWASTSSDVLLNNEEFPAVITVTRIADGNPQLLMSRNMARRALPSIETLSF